MGWQWLDVVGRILDFLFLIFVALGVIFHRGVSDWLKGRIQRSVGEALEEKRHELNRELEAHRSALLQQVEHYKANLDLKRTIALKTADARLESLRELHATLNKYAERCVTMTAGDSRFRVEHYAEFSEAVEKASSASRHAEIFISRELHGAVVNVNANGAALVQEATLSERTWRTDSEQVTAFVQEAARVLAAIREAATEPPDAL